MSPAAWCWNVVWTPNTVRLLLPFVRSLAAYSEHNRFRLVSNGCHPDEVALLEELAQSSDQFEVQVWSENCRAHGEVLTGLQQQETGRWFGIIDTDIFATAAYEQDFREALEDHAAVFTGKPIWANAEYNRMPRGFQCMSGVYGTLWDERVCGMTYCAVYDNDRLNECLQEFQISLRPYDWGHLPARVQQLFLQHGLKVAHYDTAKVANLLLGITGASLANFDAPGLTHLGGISSVTLRDPQGKSRKRTCLRLIYGLLPRFMRRLCAVAGIHTHWRIYASQAENRSDLLKAWRRHSSCLYLARVLSELNGGAPVAGPYEHEDRRLVAEVERVQQDLTDLFRQEDVITAAAPDSGEMAVLASPHAAAWE